MAEPSDSDGSSITGWAVVDKQGDIEHSDSASTSSGSDFVNLESEAVSFHHRDKVPVSTNDLGSIGTTALLGDISDEQQGELAERNHEEIANITGDSTVECLGSEGQVVGPETSTDVPVNHTVHLTLSPWDNHWFWDDACLSTDQNEDIVPLQDGNITESSSSIEELGVLIQEEDFGSASSVEFNEREVKFVDPNSLHDEDDLHQDENDLEEEETAKFGEPGVQDAEESDHSDFVRLDASMADEAVAGPSSGVQGAPDLMQASTSSNASSISPNFQFVHAVPNQHQFQPHYDYEDDDDSIPSDVDDRCESDISGVAADDTDLSAMSYGLGDVPLVGGPKSYKHWPNSSLNATLTVLALLALFTAIGIGVGHYFGSVRDVNLRQQQIYKMKTIQDDYLKCLKQQTSLEKRLKQPTVSDNKLAAVAAIWKDKYEELIVDKADLEEKIAELQNQVTTHLDMATIQVREAQEAAGKLSEDLGSLEPDLVGVQKAEYDRLHMEHDKLIEVLKSKEYELVKLNETTLFNQRAKQRYLDTLRRHLDGIAFNNLEKAQEIESLSKTLADSLIKTEKIKKDYSLTQQEALLLKEDLLNIKAKHKSDAEELIKQWEIEVKDKKQLSVELTQIKVKLNQLEVDNSELKRTISKLRYTEHPGNELESKHVKVHELKDKVNQLANENVDLKSVVVKIRYTTPVEESVVDSETDYMISKGVGSVPPPPEDLSPTSSDQQGPSAQEMDRIKEKLVEVNQQLQTEKSRSMLLQAMYVAEKEKSDKQAEFAPNIFTCFSFLFPSVNLSDIFAFQPHFMNASERVHANWAFFTNLSADSNFKAQIVEKWSSLVNYTTGPIKHNEQSSDYQEMYSEAKQVFSDIQNSINQKWINFQHLVRSSEFINKSTDKVVDAANTLHEKAKNLTSQSRFENYVNKTKESVSKLSQKIEDTWHKVKNLSEDFMKNKVVKSVAHNVQSSFNKIKDKVHDSFQQVSSHLHWRDRYNKKHHRSKHHTHNHKERKHQERKGPQDKPFEDERPCMSNCRPDNKHDDTLYSGGRALYDETFVHEDRREFEHKPPHKQKQSSNHVDDAYREFWKKVHFDPDDVIHEGFFEGNKREWRKHQKTLHKLHSRVEKLNEDIFLDMDEDDIEDMYDDLEDFEDDIEDKKEQPQGLKTWLSCQLRWWKGRIQRKKQTEKLITECGRHLMNWQLRATCSPSCMGKKCKKQSKKLAKVCKTVMDTQEPKQARSASSDLNHKSKPYRHYNSIKVTGDKTKKGTISTGHGNLKYSVTLLDTIEEEKVPEPVNETFWDLSYQDQSNWYFGRVQSREDSHTEPPTWLFDGMDYHEDQRHSPEWLFDRADERDFERGKPWYYKRADFRQRHLQSTAESDEEIGHPNP